MLQFCVCLLSICLWNVNILHVIVFILKIKHPYPVRKLRVISRKELGSFHMEPVSMTLTVSTCLLPIARLGRGPCCRKMGPVYTRSPNSLPANYRTFALLAIRISVWWQRPGISLTVSPDCDVIPSRPLHFIGCCGASTHVGYRRLLHLVYL